MKYQSTRGGVTNLTFEEAIFSPGYVADGGILMPQNIPHLSQQELQEMSSLSYVGLLKRIIPMFISKDEIPETDLQDLFSKALEKLSLEDVVKLAELKNGLNVLELFHGKTLAFKDIAISFVGQFMDYFLSKKKKHVTLVVGTSGDTGSAAIHGVCDSNWIDIVVLLPHGHCTEIQELQMTTVIKENVHVFSVDGSSDDLDVAIKKVCLDIKFRDQHKLGTMNSINWGRVMVQVVHYFYAYFSQATKVGDPVEVIIPTGALGNCTAGCLAVKMGLPLRLVCAVNKNDIVHRAFSTGDYSISGLKETISPAMNIQIAYNIERILWLFSDGDCNLVSKILVQFESSTPSTTAIPQDLLCKIQEVVSSGVVDDDTTLKTMTNCWQENNYLLCPHTAVAVAYYYRNSNSEKERPKSVCIASASPAKFPETVLKAGLTPSVAKEISGLKTMPTKYTKMTKTDDWECMLRDRIISITEKKKCTS
ncbi:threonine synthase-like 2 [Antedon mediterranea]|uniref:threonine synthase-like 2 n=1 Tax=Antedon mediterranea TaxID=105859 RepID=UPI003AF5F0DE